MLTGSSTFGLCYRCGKPVMHNFTCPCPENTIWSEQSPRVPSAEGASEREAGGGCGDAFAPIPGTLVIGIGHKARHGKDTAVACLTDTFKAARRYSFADDLYAVCRVMHGMTTKDAPLLQRVGLEWRERDQNVWVKAVYAKLLNERPQVAVLSDVRFPNEMAFVRALGGMCWKVERRLADGSVFVDPSRPADHPSETALDDARWDTVIVNREGSLDAFRDSVLCHYHASVVLPTFNQ